MTDHQAIAIGCFVIAGAHYVRDGAELWYAAYLLLAVVMLIIGKFAARSMPSPNGIKP